MGISRRTILKLASVAPLTKIAGVSVASAQDRQFRHALTLFDDIKYGPDFKNFDYVNPAAPKGGKVRISVVGSFDNLNPYTFKGETGPAVSNETLLTSSLDEPSTEYGLVAESVWFPDDWSSVVYRLRPEARFHDGTPMSPEDVIWSMQALRNSHPFYNSYYKNVTTVEKTGDREVTFTFSEKGNRELPLITGQLPVLPKHWWTGKDANGKARDIKETTLEIPLGSGPYKAAEVKSGASVVLKRVEDYWGKGLPVNVGQDNFDAIEYIYFRDANVALEAFKGDQYDYRLKSSSKNWATAFDFPAIKDGRCIKEEIHLRGVEGMQSFALNLRREKFQDVRVRKAFNYAFDFEWSNTNLFYGQYTRSRSYFNNSEMEAKGLPSPEELKLLEPLRDQLPAEVFTTEYANPVSNNATERRKNLREASRLLAEAGWNVTQDGKIPLPNAKGERLEVGCLLESPLFERIALPYQQQLELLGVVVKIKTVDGAQYERQTQTFEYDIILLAAGDNPFHPAMNNGTFGVRSPLTEKELPQFLWNQDPAIDKLVDAVIFSKDRKGSHNRTGRWTAP